MMMRTDYAEKDDNQTANLANPRVVAGPLISGAMTAVNQNVHGILSREDGKSIARILIASNMAYIPQGQGE